jgi:F0F1-type ATP synthase membrane subunit c/vacuolar-type H+-ATPase subunit K
MIENAVRITRMLYLALLVSVGTYGLIVFLITNNQTPKELDPIMLYALAGAAATTMVMIVVLRGKLLPPTREAHSLSEPIPEDEQVKQALGRLFTASIITWALCESIAIYGLVLSFISFQPKYFLGFAAASLVNFVIYRPQKELWLGAARAAG